MAVSPQPSRRRPLPEDALPVEVFVPVDDAGYPVSDEGEPVPERPAVVNPLTWHRSLSHEGPPERKRQLDSERFQLSFGAMLGLLSVCCLLFALGRQVPPAWFAGGTGIVTLVGMFLLSYTNLSIPGAARVFWLLMLGIYIVAFLRALMGT